VTDTGNFVPCPSDAKDHSSSSPQWRTVIGSDQSVAQRSVFQQNGANLIQISHNSVSSHKVYVLLYLCAWRSFQHPAVCLALPACLKAKQTAIVTKYASLIFFNFSLESPLRPE
jgi:hypothetical protein